jgi:hypothetical protein
VLALLMALLMALLRALQRVISGLVSGVSGVSSGAVSVGGVGQSLRLAQCAQLVSHLPHKEDACLELHMGAALLDRQSV